MIEAVALTTGQHPYLTLPPPTRSTQAVSYHPHLRGGLTWTLSADDGEAAEAVHPLVANNPHNHIRTRLARIRYQVKHSFLTFFFETFTTLFQVRGTFEEVSRTCVENPAKGSFGLANIIYVNKNRLLKIR